MLTFNEEVHIRRALECISTIAKEVFIVDSYSTDKTVEIAQSMGAIVLQNKFINYSKQYQWALDNSPITATWVMRLDADEVIEPDLQAEIQTKLPALPSDVAGISLKRKHIFLDRWIRHGGRYPLVLMRIWRSGQGRIEDRWMDEHMVVWGGRTVTFDGGFADYNLYDLTYFVDKHNKYATREALDILMKKYQLSEGDDSVNAKSSSAQASAKRWIKERIYNRIPFQISVTLYFLYRYFLLLGFLDGREGLYYHYLQGFWYRFLVGAKASCLEKSISKLPDAQSMKLELAKLTGLKVE